MVLDLNGDGDIQDSFEVTWFHNETRLWDAIIDGEHGYAIFEGPPDDMRRLETYYLENGQPKLFQLGNKTHTLQRENKDYGLFGLECQGIVTHPSPNFELYYTTTSLSAVDFKINEIPVIEDYVWSGRELYPPSGEMQSRVYLVPDYSFQIDTGETITISCTLITHDAVTCDIALLMNWSPDGNTRKRWVPIYHQAFETIIGPDFLLEDSSVTSIEPNIKQLSVTIKNHGHLATSGTTIIPWEQV